jgi:Nucleotide-diphospho-sugar transferase
MADNRQGIVYSGTGEFYVAEALRSARSSLRHNQVPHVLFSDGETSGADGLTVTRFEPSGNPYVDKIANMRRSPFERTIYLDSDTYVVDEIVHVLALLDNYDLAVAFAPAYRGLDDPGVPKAFHEFNTGVLAWRANERTTTFMESWQRTYEAWLSEDELFPGARKASRSRRADQPAFRRCAWEHGLSVFVLSPEYNFRLGYPATVIDRVRVIHGDHPDPEALAARLNAQQKLRAWPPPLTLGEKVRRRVMKALGRGPQSPATPRTAARDAGSD